MTFADTSRRRLAPLAVVAGVALPGASMNPSAFAEAPEGVFVEFDPPSPAPIGAMNRQIVLRLRDAAVEQQREGAGPLHELLQSARLAAQQQPRPLAIIVYEGRVSNDPQRIASVRHLQDMAALHDLTWSWHLSGDPSLAEAGIRYLMHWMEQCPPSGNDVNDHKLTPMLEAFEALNPLLRPDQRATARAWTARFAEAHWRGLQQAFADGRANTNRTSKRVKMLLQAAVVLDDEAEVQRALDAYRRHMALALRADGSSHDLNYRGAMHYHVSTVRALVETAVLARAVGVDLLDEANPQGGSLRRSLDWILPYARGEKVHEEWVHSQVGLDRRRWESGDPFYRPGKPWNPAAAADVFALASLLDPGYAPVASSLAARREAELSFLLRAVLALDGPGP